MYRSCIFCSAALGSNESIERFPVGRSLAFDAAKGRLWAVCPKCARWNLAPLEERWEAVEDAERRFRDTRLRAQSENVGLAKLRDGTRLIRVGEALPGELAAWRYGETLARRRRRMLIRTAPVTVAGVGIFAAGVLAGAGAFAAWSAGRMAVDTTIAAIRRRRVVLEVRAEDGSRVSVQRRHLARARLAEDGDDLALHLPPLSRDRRDPDAQPLVLRGSDARLALVRSMVHVNAAGATRRATDGALEEIQRAGSAGEFLREVARRRPLLNGQMVWHPEPTEWAIFKERFGGLLDSRSWFEPISFSPHDWVVTQEPAASPVAVEMALHEETERRALEGELAMLEAMWREAEQIAAIADRLPDVVPPDPPQIQPRG
jgi:hypothetical protein